MQRQSEWESLRPRTDRASPAISPLRVTLLFGLVAVALALMAVSYLDGGSGRRIAGVAPTGLDFITTGAIAQPKTYIVRKSVLQSSPQAECLITPDGRRSGDC